MIASQKPKQGTEDERSRQLEIPPHRLLGAALFVTIDIDSFVPRAEIDQRFFDAPYYITWPASLSRPSR
jgi:hypothetical protein